MQKHFYDVIIIGGSYAGLSAAMVLGRSLRDVLVIDSGEPCNRQTPHSHNFLTQDGKTPAEISALARQQVEQYETVQFLNGLASKGRKVEGGFEMDTRDGEAVRAKKLMFATGVKDLMPDIKGFSECWGISVIHCPYCHGYENRSKLTGIMTKGEHATHFVPLIFNLSKDVVFFTQGKHDVDPDFLKKMKQKGIEIIESSISEIVHQDGYMREVILKAGKKVKLDALYAPVPFEQSTDIPASLGCELTEQGLLKVDMLNATTVPGVYACGDSIIQFRAVAQAVSSGNIAGAALNRELAMEAF
tara:strand:+ start:186 stop:1091 length:906 start_codon:yes stop_codon:yes gene_type:complete